MKTCTRLAGVVCEYFNHLMRTGTTMVKSRLDQAIPPGLESSESSEAMLEHEWAEYNPSIAMLLRLAFPLEEEDGLAFLALGMDVPGELEGGAQ
ncbi:MAG: hypothetical protein ACKVP2_09435 [Burkholderiales bacterium]